MKKGNVPSYVMSGIAILFTIIGWFYVRTADSASSDIAKALDGVSALKDRTTVLEANYSNLKETADDTNKTVKELYKLLK